MFSFFFSVLHFQHVNVRLNVSHCPHSHPVHYPQPKNHHRYYKISALLRSTLPEEVDDLEH